MNCAKQYSIMLKFISCQWQVRRVFLTYAQHIGKLIFCLKWINLILDLYIFTISLIRLLEMCCCPFVSLQAASLSMHLTSDALSIESNASQISIPRTMICPGVDISWIKLLNKFLLMAKIINLSTKIVFCIKSQT